MFGAVFHALELENSLFCSRFSYFSLALSNSIVSIFSKNARNECKKLWEEDPFLLKKRAETGAVKRAVKKHAGGGTAGEDNEQEQKTEVTHLCNNLLHKLLHNRTPLPRPVMEEIETGEGLTVMRSWEVKMWSFGHLVIWSFSKNESVLFGL